MGNHDEWLQPRGGLLANGLLPDADPLLDSLDSVRWLKAEERTAELIACIQPNQPSEELRNAVADYVQRLIMKCFPCQVFTFGSVPLKTYLPDGDIDLTAFSNNVNLKDSWATEVRDMLESEEKNKNAEFRVKEVQYIQAEVKIIKCLVENIVVDVSFNQLGGLCTLCFLEEVDNLINQNHLFKRSIILIKAWCYYESRILGAHHGLISTYGLETLVLYIFHVFNNSFTGPLEVLYRFLEFFSIFDWENFCVSLWGPVPISSLPDVTAETPRKDIGELLLNKVFLDACSSVYAVFPSGQENQGQTFVSKHFNVIDPLRVSNNLGRSVSKGNFFRIRSAFALGAKNLARLLDCPQENLVSEVNQFFTNTWDRHGSGIRPDAPSIDSSLCFNSSVVENQNVTDILNINSTGKKFKEFIGRENEFEDTRSRNSSHTHNQKICGKLNRSQKNLISSQIQLVNDIQRSPFARTQSSPELTESGKSKNQGASNRRKDVESELPNNTPTHLGFDGSGDLNNGSIGAQGMHQEEQDLVNMMASLAHMPMGHLPFPLSPSFLAGMGYAQKNFSGMVPANFPMIDYVQFQHGLVSPQLTNFFSGFGMTSNEDSIEPSNENFTSVELSSVDAERDENSWRERDLGSTVEGFEPDRVRSEVVVSDNKRSLVGLNYVPPPRRVGGSGGLVRSQHKHHNKEKCGPLKDDDAFSDERTTSSRFFSAAHTNSLKSKTSSESSWDETSTVNKSTKEKRDKKPVVSSESSSSGYVKGKIMSEDDELDIGSDTTDRTLGHVSESMIPTSPMIIGPNSKQRMTDNSGATPLTFYPTGPPVPFLTMLPFYNVPSQPSSSDTSRSHFDNHENIENGNVSPNFHNSLRGPAPGATPDERKCDILNSDFASHWQNLQFGRLCQSPWQHGSMLYPSPSMVPPVYLQGRVPWDGPGRPTPNMNLITQLMNCGPRLIPVTAPVQSVSSRHPNVYQRYMEDLPRYRSGTGTYLPNPVAVRNRNSSGPQRTNYNHDRGDNIIERGGNWNANSKPRGSGRSHNRNQTGKPNRSKSSYRHDSFSTYQTQNSSLHPSSSQSCPGNVVYGMYSNPNGPSSNDSTDPSMVIVYPYKHNSGFGSHTEPLEFESVDQVGLSGVNEQAQINDGSRARVPFEEHRLYASSPDRPSSPRHQRRI